MNWINDRKLARRLKAGDVPPQERFYYFFMTLLIGGLLTSSLITPWIYTITYELWDIAMDVFYLTVIFFGTLFIHHTNKTGDNKEFIERFICLSLPITIQIILAVMIVLAAIFFYYEISQTEELISQTRVYNFIFFALQTAYFYFRLNQSMKIASH